MASWEAPSGISDKLNVKGLITDGGETCTFGCVLRGLNGRWIMGCGGQINVRCRNDDEAEFLAVYHGLRTAWDSGHHYIELEVESPSAVRLMKRPQVGLMNPLLGWAKFAMSWDWDQLDITSIEVPANELAFELASYCMRYRSTDGIIIFDAPPNVVMGTYEEECHRSSSEEEDDDEDDEDDEGDDDDGGEGHDSN